MAGAAVTTTLQMSRVIPALRLCYEAGPLAAMLWGPPGIAKSALIRKFAEEMKLDFIDIRLPLFDPVDLKGIPALHEVNVTRNGKKITVDVTRFHAPDFLPHHPCIILFDELANALPATQTAAQRIILDRSSDGGWEAHPQTMIIAASNRKTDRTGVNTMPMALDNRLVHFEIQPDYPFWESWLLSTYSETPESREASALIVAFLAFRSEHAYRFEADAAAKGIHGYPTFRSWEAVCKLLVAANKRKLSFEDPVLCAAVEGTVGVGTGREFIMFARLRDQLPDPDMIMAGGQWDVPQAIDVKYALIGALAARVNEKNCSEVWNIVAKFEAVNAIEFALCMVRMSIKQHKKLAQNKEFISWAQRHKLLVGL